MPIQNASWYIYLGLFQPISVTCCILNRNQLFHFYWESNDWFLYEIQYRVEMDWFDQVKPSFLRAQFTNYHLIKMWKLETAALSAILWCGDNVHIVRSAFKQVKGFLKTLIWIIYINPSLPDPRWREKINSKFSFHASS